MSGIDLPCSPAASCRTCAEVVRAIAEAKTDKRIVFFISNIYKFYPASIIADALKKSRCKGTAMGVNGKNVLFQIHEFGTKRVENEYFRWFGYMKNIVKKWCKPVLTTLQPYIITLLRFHFHIPTSGFFLPNKT